MSVSTVSEYIYRIDQVFNRRGALVRKGALSLKFIDTFSAYSSRETFYFFKTEANMMLKLLCTWTLTLAKNLTFYKNINSPDEAIGKTFVLTTGFPYLCPFARNTHFFITELGLYGNDEIAGKPYARVGILIGKERERERKLLMVLLLIVFNAHSMCTTEMT